MQVAANFVGDMNRGWTAMLTVVWRIQYGADKSLE